MGSSFGVVDVRVIHAEGTDDETVTQTHAHVQPKAGYFEVDTPIYEGDVVEVPDPRQGSDGFMRRVAVKVDIYDTPGTKYIHATWGESAPPRVAPVRRLSIENLHPEVQDAAGALFADGHFEPAVSEAFKSLEVRVRSMTGLAKSGAALMGEALAFQKDDPLVDVAVHDGQSGKDEREGFHAIFRGVMLGIRNPKAHELFATEDPQQALEYLGLASLLHRRLDSAVVKIRESG